MPGFNSTALSPFKNLSVGKKRSKSLNNSKKDSPAAKDE